MAPATGAGLLQHAAEVVAGNLGEGLRRAVDGHPAQHRRGAQVGARGQVADQFGEDGHQLVVPPLPGRPLAVDQVAPRAGQRAQGLHQLVGDRAGPCPPRQQATRQQATRQRVGVDPVGFRPQAQTTGPRRRLVRIEQHDGVARLAQRVVERFPPAAGRLPPNQQGCRRAPLPQPLQPLGVARGRGGDRRALEADGATGRLPGADDMRGLGHVAADDAADLGGQQATHRLLRLDRAGGAGSDLTSRARFPSPGALAGLLRTQGAGVRPSTVRSREAGTGVFLRRSGRKERRRPFPARCPGRGSSRLPIPSQI